MRDSRPLVEIIIDGGAGYGLGSVSRMRTLSQRLLEDGFAIRWQALSAMAREAISDRRSVEEGRPALTVLDLPYNGTRWAEDARRADRPVIAIGYQGRCEIDLSIHLDAPLEPGPARRVLHGLDYALIRPELRETVVETGAHVLVALGARDEANSDIDAAIRLKQAGAQPVVLRNPVAGPAGKAADALDIRTNPAEQTFLMASCAWAVANAGTILPELMYLGKAVHVLPQSEGERHLAQDLAAQGAVLGIGLDMLAPPDPSRQAQVAMKASSLVDGQGAARISALCRGLVG